MQTSQKMPKKRKRTFRHQASSGTFPKLIKQADESSKTNYCLGFMLEKTLGAWSSGDKQGRLTVPRDLFGSLLQARLHSTQWFTSF